MINKIKRCSLLSAGFASLMLVSGEVSAQTLGDMLLDISQNTSLIEFVNLCAYILGTFLVALGLNKVRTHMEYGPQNVPLAEPLKYLGAGGMMLSFPTIATVVTNGFGDGGAAQQINGLGWDVSTIASSGVGGLDTMLFNFIQGSYYPFQLLIQFFCFVAGAILLLVAIHRFTKTAQEGVRGPTGLGTIATFMLAGALFSIAPMIGMFAETLFGNRESAVSVDFMALDASLGVTSANAENVLVAVLGFLIIVGILSIVRGFFVLRGVAEGAQGNTMMGGLSHVIAGAILVNFGQFANIIQNTLGIGSFGVLFN